MIDAKERETLNSGMRPIWVIWGAMLASLGIYFVLGHTVIAKIKMTAMSPDEFVILRNAIYVVALIELAIIPLLRKTMLKAPLKGTQNPAFTHPTLGKYNTVTVVSLAISESIAIYSILLLLLGGDFQSFYILTAISAVAMIVFRPKVEEVEKLALALKANETNRTF